MRQREAECPSTTIEIQQKILQMVPVYPREISKQRVCDELGLSGPRKLGAILDMMSTIMIAEDDDTLCFLSQSDRVYALKRISQKLCMQRRSEREKP